MKDAGDIHAYCTSTCLRLLGDYTDCVMIGDDLFTSVSLALALIKRNVDYVGVKKRLSKEFPYQYLSNTMENAEPGTTTVLSTTVKLTSHHNEERQLLAIGYKSLEANHHINTILSTIGSVLPIGEVESPEDSLKPRVIHEMRRFFSHAVDDHNNYRQGIQKVEESWKTQHCPKRFFATMLGMVAVNAYLAYKYELSIERPDMKPETYMSFIGHLAASLCPQLTQLHYGDARDNNMVAHKIKRIRDCEHYSGEGQENKRRRLRCRICKQSVSDYCETCSTRTILAPVQIIDYVSRHILIF
jgi:hypothetical protein